MSKWTNQGTLAGSSTRRARTARQTRRRNKTKASLQCIPAAYTKSNIGMPGWIPLLNSFQENPENLSSIGRTASVPHNSYSQQPLNRHSLRPRKEGFFQRSDFYFSSKIRPVRIHCWGCGSVVERPLCMIQRMRKARVRTANTVFIAYIFTNIE